MDFLQILWDVSVYLSLAGLVLLVLTFLTGLRIIKPKAKYRLHKKFSIGAVTLVGIHAVVMIYFYFFT